MSDEARFSEPRAEGRGVAFDAAQGGRTWTFRVPEDALAVANLGELADGDPMATFAKCRRWLQDIAARYVAEGHPSDAPIVLDAATLATQSDR